jgi:phosphate/sulfate permease
MPVSLAEIVTCSVIGFSCAANGLKGTARNEHVRRILVLWPAAPAAAGLIAFALQYAVR